MGPRPGRGVLFLAAGLLALGCGGGQGGAAASAEPEPAVPADYMGPLFTIDAPPRGSIVAGGGETPWPVSVRGQVCDAARPLASVRVEGTEQALAPGAACRRLEVEHPARWGLSVVRGEATNGAGEKGYLAQAIIRSPAYFARERGDPASRAASGILVALDASFVDDGDRSRPDDVATILETALAGLDLDAAVGDVRFASPDADGDGRIDAVSHGCVLWTEWNKATGFEAWKSGPFSHAGMKVEHLALRAGGFSVRITVRGPRVPFGVMGNLDSGCLGDADRTAEGEARAEALSVEGVASVVLGPGGRPEVTFSATAAQLTGLQLDIALGPLLDWTGLGDLIADAITGRVQGPIQDAIREAIGLEVGGVLSRVLGSLTRLEQSFALPDVLGRTELVLESGIDHLEITPQRAVLGAYVHVRPVSPRPEHLAASPFGAMAMGGSPPDVGAVGSVSAALGVKDDALNQLLHAAWLGGAFDLRDASWLLGRAGPEGLELSVYSTLPPLVMPREAGAPGLDLGWGDVAFELKLPPQLGSVLVAGFASVVVPLERLGVDPATGTFGPVFGLEAQVHVQITAVSGDHRPATRRVVTELMEAALRSAIPEVLARAAHALPLPELDPSWIDGGLPRLVLALADARADRVGPYHLLSGKVVARP